VNILGRVVINVETKRPESVRTYLIEILSTLSKNEHFSIEKFSVEISEK